MGAPAICDVRFPLTGPRPKSNVDWIESLSRAALVAIQLPETKAGRKAK
jgi:hypothetical protein